MAADEDSPSDRLIRHRLVDRVYHWTMATSVLVLLGTSFLPIAGLKFPWIDAHWIAGVVLSAAVAYHIVRALTRQDPRSMLIGLRDLRAAVRATQWVLRQRKEAPQRPGKYPLPQKLYHHGIAILILLAIVTGILMMAKIDGPFWTRNPYLLSSNLWAAIYVVHDLAAMAVLAGVMIHVYFAIRPEKLWMTRSMILGWITRSEYLAHYDAASWKAEPVDEGKPAIRR
ncbi:MAG: cytochrome b/b6 domain-containing protein [Betaproteobacteria bacterium]|nr:cytochrome b/b6 domain-containing protein [Betaproteobacteria bacterium]